MRDFPGGPEVKIFPFNVGGAGSISDWGAKTHMPFGHKTKAILWQNKKKNQTPLKTVHIKKKKKKEKKMVMNEKNRLI